MVEPGGDLTPQITSITELTFMQEFATLSERNYSDVLGSMTEETVYTLKDQRDNKDYKIAKLKDGRVWMVEDLALKDFTCTTDNSDVATEFAVLASDITKFIDGDNVNAMYTSDDGRCYYSWFTATAGTGTADVETGEATGSIAPKGWRLPTEAEFGYLADIYEDDPAQLMATVPGFALGGDVGSGKQEGNGTSGNYWSLTTYNASQAYSLYLSSNTVDPASMEYKNTGMTVRCILRPSEEITNGGVIDPGTPSSGQFFVGDSTSKPTWCPPESFYYGTSLRPVPASGVAYSRSKKTLYLVSNQVAPVLDMSFTGLTPTLGSGEEHSPDAIYSATVSSSTDSITITMNYEYTSPNPDKLVIGISYNGDKLTLASSDSTGPCKMAVSKHTTDTNAAQEATSEEPLHKGDKGYLKAVFQRKEAGTGAISGYGYEQSRGTASQTTTGTYNVLWYGDGGGGGTPEVEGELVENGDVLITIPVGRSFTYNLKSALTPAESGGWMGCPTGYALEIKGESLGSPDFYHIYIGTDTNGYEITNTLVSSTDSPSLYRYEFFPTEEDLASDNTHLTIKIAAGAENAYTITSVSLIRDTFCM